MLHTLPTTAPPANGLARFPNPDQVLRIADRMVALSPERAEALLDAELQQLARRRHRQGVPPDRIAAEWQALERRVRTAVRLMRAAQPPVHS